MSATTVKANGECTLPPEICRAAGIRTLDQVDWRFEAGEIRGRKLSSSRQRARKVRPTPFKDLLILPSDIGVDLDQWDKELKEEREHQDERLLG